MTSSGSSSFWGFVRSSVGVEYCIVSDIEVLCWDAGRGPTILVPVIQAGFVIFARRGMTPTVRVRGAQLSDAGVLLANVQRDMCVIWRGTASKMMQLFERSIADRNLGYPQRVEWWKAGGRQALSMHSRRTADAEKRRTIQPIELRKQLEPLLHSKCRRHGARAASLPR